MAGTWRGARWWIFPLVLGVLGTEADQLEVCTQGYVLTELHEAEEHKPGVKTAEACWNLCRDDKICLDYAFDTGGCRLIRRGEGGAWCRRETTTERHIRHVWDKALTRGKGWSEEPDLPQQWCNPVSEAGDLGEAGWAEIVEGVTTEVGCRSACEEDDFCIGVSYFEDGDDDEKESQIVSILDKVREPPCSVLQSLGSTLTTGGRSCKSNFNYCINRPYNASDTEALLRNSSKNVVQQIFGSIILGQSLNQLDGSCFESRKLPQCTKCYRMVSPCSSHGDGQDCTMVEVRGQKGGTYMRPETACPSVAGPVQEGGGGWFSVISDSCSFHPDSEMTKIGSNKDDSDNNEDDDSSKKRCTCTKDDEKPCARRTMGAQEIPLGETGYPSEMVKEMAPGIHTSVNEEAQCVSEDEYCKLRHTFGRVSAVRLSFLQAQLATLGLQGIMLNGLDSAEDAGKKKACDLVLNTGSELEGPLESLQIPPAVITARIFGMLQCYLDMVTSDDKDRGREFGRCIVKSVLRLTFYLATEFTAMGALQQGDVLHAVNKVLDSAADSSRVFDTVEAIDDNIDRATGAILDVQDKLDKASQAAEKGELVNKKLGLDHGPQWYTWGFDKTVDLVKASAQVAEKVGTMVSSLENMFVETSTLVVSTVIDQNLDLNSWAKSQPHMKASEICGNVSDAIVESAFDKMRQITRSTFAELQDFASNFSVIEELPITSCTMMPSDSLCGTLGHGYKIDTQFRDANFFSCHERSITKKYRALSESKDIKAVLDEHEVCADSMRDLLCLSNYPACGKESACETYTPCMIACRNLNTCARSLAYSAPFDCSLQCACASNCSDMKYENPLQTYAETHQLCREMCDSDNACMDECTTTFREDLGEACKSVNAWETSLADDDSLQKKFSLMSPSSSSSSSSSSSMMPESSKISGLSAHKSWYIVLASMGIGLSAVLAGAAGRRPSWRASYQRAPEGSTNEEAELARLLHTM